MMDVEALEAAGYATWTPDQMTDIAGWRLYATEGYTRRVNCATGVGELPTDPDVRAAVTGWLTQRGARPVVRVTPLLGPHAVEAISRTWGYRSIDRTLVLTAPVLGKPGDDRILRMPTTDAGFLDDLARLNGRSPDTADVRFRMMARISDCASGLWIPGIAVALIAVAGPLGAVYSLAVDPTHRGKGIARSMMVAADAWASEHGAETLFLQVLETNESAVGLYRSLGFTERYAYHYLDPGADAPRVLSDIEP